MFKSALLAVTALVLATAIRSASARHASRGNAGEIHYHYHYHGPYHHHDHYHHGGYNGGDSGRNHGAHYGWQEAPAGASSQGQCAYQAPLAYHGRSPSCGGIPSSPSPSDGSFTTTVSPPWNVPNELAFTFTIQKLSPTPLWSPPTDTKGFTLHGLWPNFAEGSTPIKAFCCPGRSSDCDYSAATDLTSPWPEFTHYVATSYSVWNNLGAEMREEMSQYYRSFHAEGRDCQSDAQKNNDFWWHEYTKHGTACTRANDEALDPATYFGYALDILKKVDDWYPTASNIDRCTSQKGCTLTVKLPK